MMELQGSKVTLRKLDENDVSKISELLNNPAVTELTLRLRSPYSIEDAKGFVKHALNKKEEDGYKFAICVNNELVGVIGFSLKGNKGSIGYWIGEPYQRKGYASDAIRAVLKLGFETLDVDFIDADTFEENIPSYNLLKKCGFEDYEFKEKAYEKDRRIFNAFAMRITKEKYKKLFL